MTTEVSLNNNIEGITNNNFIDNLTESNPTVTTDKDDYAPGETAQITGDGFTPGSEVVIQIVDDSTKPGDDGDIDIYQPITVITDEFGSFNTTWFVPTDDDGTGAGTPDALNATLFLTATGTGTDGVLGTEDDRVAETTFTDGRPTSQTTGSYGRSSQNTGQDNVTVDFSFYLDVADTDSSSDRGFFSGAVAFYTKTTFSTFNQTTTTNADLKDLDLSVFRLVNSPNLVVINYSFIDPDTSSSVGSFRLVFGDIFPSPPEENIRNSLVNDIEFIGQNVSTTYRNSLDSFFGTPSKLDRQDLNDPTFNDDLSVNGGDETVVPVAPVATDNTATVTEDLTLTASGNLITDDDGAGTDNDDGLSSQPDFNNLSIAEIAGITDPNTDVVGTFGTLDWNADGFYTYSLNNDNAAVQSLDEGETLTDTFTYTLRDDENLSDTAELTITINGVNDNTPPNAEDDNLTTGEDDLLAAIALLDNDSDPDEDPLSISDINTTGIQGTLTDNGDGTFNYNPNGQFEFLAVGETATDTFNYTISDGFLTDNATVNITINGVNDTPTANSDSGTGFITDEDTTFTTASVLTNDTDPDINDILSVVSIDTSNTSGLVTDNEDGTFSYNPNGAFESLNDGDTATDTVSYIVSDDNGGTSTNTVEITINGITDDNTPEINNIDGTRNDDNISGTGENDFIAANNGNDTVNARGGNDTVEGGRGGDIISGGAGDDVLAADRVDRFDDFDGETSEIRGNAGNDTIFGGAKNDLLIGNSGNDSIFGKSGDDLLRGGRDDDLLNGGVGNDRIQGGGGFDTADYSDLAINGVFGTVAGLDANLRNGEFKHSSTNNALTWTDTVSGVENVTGTQRNDRFVNRGNNNIFDGQGEIGRSDRQTIFESIFTDGSYSVIGDVAEYQGNSDLYIFAGEADDFTVTRNGQTDTLIDIEFVKFNDGVFATSELNFV